MANYIPAKDDEFKDWLGNFIIVANANLATLGLIAGDITQLSTDRGTLDTAINDAEVKKAASKSATQLKDTIRKSAEGKVRGIVKRIQANTAVSNALKAQLQITITSSASSSSPTPISPTALIPKVIGSGEYELSWSRNGNKNGTFFVIEAIIGSAGSWTQIFATTKTKYIHGNNTPGEKIVYRVKAQRGEFQSSASNIAIVNDGAPV